ncbi:MAG: amino acid adenylation domain-containing protein [Lachnospiraceae bacterium]|nr:amino acid adenylation domain-containing protein [Lachnospiraceae bacterium]
MKVDYKTGTSDCNRPRKRKGYVMTACAHHAVIDLESMNVLLSQLAENYQRLYNGLELESFTESKYEKFINDYTKYLDSENGTKDRDFWNEKLMGALPIVDLSVKKRPEKVTYNGDVFRSCISGNANWEINELAKKLNVTPFNILITAYYILMYKYTSENDIIIGMSATLRNDFGCENTVGDFINLLPIRTKVRSDMTFAEFSIVVKREILSALEHQKFSFKKILENINTAGTQGFSPVVQVAFSQENLNVEDNKNLSGFVTGHHANFSFSEISLSARGSEILYTPYDLLLMADTSGQNVNLAWQYNTDILNKEFIENMTLHYENILKAVLDNSDVKIKHIKMLTQVEYNKLFHEFNEVHGDEYDNRMFIDAFEEIVDKFGHHIAVSMNNERETYGSFNEKANQIGRYLQSMGAKKGDCVALCLNKSIKTMEVLIAILKIGCVYVPMDPEYPMNRINYILTETKANIVFAEDNWKQKGVGCPDCKIVTIKNLEENMNRFSHENIHIKIFPNDLAYIIFTSGTTGKPKGVMIEHIGICNMVKGLNEGWGVRKDSKVLQFASLSFDASIAEIFIALLSGGELVLKSKNEIMPGGDLERVLVEEEITEVILTPSVLMLTNPKKISKLRTVLSAGESCNKAVVEKWGSGRRFVNAYGPTESTVCASYKLCDPSDAENITIGKAILGTKLYILDNDLNPVPIGMPGELCISSIGLARGYFNRPDITDEKFVHNTIDKNAFNKIYRTSDIARFTKDGYIKFCGRKDNQVKIRGFRIEIDEVENILNKCDGVKEAAVIIKEFFNDKKLVAFVCGSDSCNEGSLRKQMKSELPHYMVPSYFEFVDELPHSISGKIDKKIVETFDILAKDIYVDDSLYTDTQKRLRKIWCKVLGNEDITLNSDFYESGGHSLSGAQAKIEIEKEFGVSLDIVDILEISKFIDLCNRIEEKSRESINNIKVMTSYKEKNYIPVTYAQNQLLFIWQLNNNSTEYNISGDVELKGELDVERFKEAYRNIVHLNHSLRTIFFKENNKYYQKICDDISKYELEMIEDCSKEKLDIYVDELKNWRFDLLNGPLVKSRLMRIGKNRYVLAFAVHHIISDGWSVALMVNMWSKEYNRLKTENTGNEEHKYQFSDYAIWSSEYIQGKRLEKLENYWIRKLKGTEDRVLDLVTDYKRPKLHTSKGEIWRHELDRELTKAIQKTASDNHGTLFMVLFAAFNVLLNKLTRKNDFNIGIPVAGRNLPETQNMLGMFINTIVMRTKIHDSDSFQELMRRVKEETLANLDNQDMPFERLVELLNPKRDMSYSPLFQILFNMLNIEKPIFNLNDIKTNSTKQTSGNSKYDMTIYISDGEKICFEFLYNRNLFSKEHIKLIASQYERILLQISKNDMICIEDIDIHEEDYLEEKVAEKVDTENIAELLRNSFLENDNKLAICSPQNTVNYHELDRMVKKYAAYLQSVVNDEWVYIYGDRNIKFIIIILACVFSGKSFAMIDSKYPINRIKNMIDSIQNKILIDASDEKNLLNRISDEYKEILFSDEVKNEFEYIPTKKDSHYIIFTSGTTGKPKAIKSKVSSVLHFIKWYVDKFELTDMDKFSMLSGLSHDPIMRDIFTPLLLGASLYIPSEEVMSVPGKMNEWLNSNKISIIHQTPSILKMLSDIMLETVRLLCLGGEGLYDYHLKKISSLFKKSKVVNVYGTSETPQVMAFYEVRGNEQGIVPIGKGIDGVKVFVADKKCKPVGRMGIGEIIVQTKYLSEGYITGLNSKEGFTYVSGERAYRTGDLGYVDMNNNVVLLAREDEQIKNRGYRIEPSEIEREILSISYIKEAKVLLCDDKLTAFLVESSPNVWSISEIKQKLLDVLPVYMVPELYIKVDTIPLTENGKVDNRALKEMKQHNTKETIHKVSPEGSIQEIVGRIWKELLNIEDIGVEDNFFDIGGHSFMLLELNERLQKVLDCNFEMVDLFQYPTIKLFSEYIESKKTDDFVIFFRQTDTNRKKEALRNKRMKRGKIKT